MHGSGLQLAYLMMRRQPQEPFRPIEDLRNALSAFKVESDVRAEIVERVGHIDWTRLRKLRSQPASSS